MKSRELDISGDLMNDFSFTFIHLAWWLVGWLFLNLTKSRKKMATYKIWEDYGWKCYLMQGEVAWSAPLLCCLHQFPVEAFSSAKHLRWPKSHRFCRLMPAPLSCGLANGEFSCWQYISAVVLPPTYMSPDRNLTSWWLLYDQRTTRKPKWGKRLCSYDLREVSLSH